MKIYRTLGRPAEVDGTVHGDPPCQYHAHLIGLQMEMLERRNIKFIAIAKRTTDVTVLCSFFGARLTTDIRVYRTPLHRMRFDWLQGQES